MTVRITPFSFKDVLCRRMTTPRPPDISLTSLWTTVSATSDQDQMKGTAPTTRMKDTPLLLRVSFQFSWYDVWLRGLTSFF